MGQSGTPQRPGDRLREVFEENLNGGAFATTFEGKPSIPYITDRPPMGDDNHNHPRYTRSAVIGNPRIGGRK